MSRLAPGIEKLVFMTGGGFSIAGADCFVTRSGYTGEDGFEISVSAEQDRDAGQSAAGRSRKSNRLAWAHAIRCVWKPGCACTATTLTRRPQPVEAGLNWAMQKVRRADGARAGGFPGAIKIMALRQMIRRLQP